MTESILNRMDGIVGEMVREGIPLRDAARLFESCYIGRALASTNGNVTRASLKLGVHRNTLHGRIRTHKAVW